MSTTEAELVALADCAIELLYIKTLLEFIGFEITGAILVETDSKGAHDLCHRVTAGPSSRHVERKVNKMRELQREGKVSVTLIPTDENTADIFTKVLDNATFARHRATLYNVAARVHEANDAVEGGK